ncbi:hypothetical protein JQ596_01970 [Bradyrhizobium manausense]|uniref:hypothetical protein n=1 Tax=Bradyrhizobium TaxID=374 RepID=UPI001BA78BC3|nr:MULTISPECIES: hypothetical protein [Bradyrhizobium]MBR0824287.1 hypothetical protein [Bradyrhizobium manausense]UVO26688.1 hypothetical protein KUF59_29575 [Bradyrhizobium arachidis]
MKVSLERFPFLRTFLALSWHRARQPVRARWSDMPMRYVLTTMDKAAAKIKYAPRQSNSDPRNSADRN